MNLMACVERCAQRLEAAGLSFGHGTGNAFDEAVWLVLWRLGLPLDELEEQAGRALAAEEEAAVESLLQQRIQSRQPLAYLTGEAWLQGLAFEVNADVIVPRSLIAEPLADGTLDSWLPAAPERVLDLCTGGGSLACLAALVWPQTTVLGTDLSAPALAVAARNIVRHGLQERVQLAQGDGLQAAPVAVHGRFDLVLCNPPYVPDRSMRQLPAEYLAEPRLALAGGPDGMDFVRQLLQQVADHLNPQGLLVLEIGHEQQHFENNFRGLFAPSLGLRTARKIDKPTHQTRRAGPPGQPPTTQALAQPIWLPTSSGDEQVLMLGRPSLAALAKRRSTSRHPPP